MDGYYLRLLNLLTNFSFCEYLHFFFPLIFWYLLFFIHIIHISNVRVDCCCLLMIVSIFGQTIPLRIKLSPTTMSTWMSIIILKCKHSHISTSQSPWRWTHLAMEVYKWAWNNFYLFCLAETSLLRRFWNIEAEATGGERRTSVPSGRTDASEQQLPQRTTHKWG